MNNNARVRLACYTTNITMSAVGNLSPLLFLTFRTIYGISYSLLGLLVLINFVTQLVIDLIFSFFSYKFNIARAVKTTPLLAIIGFVFYALSPFLFPSNVYIGLVIGTVIFSAASGFAEVLISPVISALPSDNPDRDLSKLHSIYAWGVVGVVAVTTLFLLVLDASLWWILPLLFALIPLVAYLLFFGAELPAMKTPERLSGTLSFFKDKWLYLSVLGIFLGGAIECTMAQWCSAYLESAVGIPKVMGDILGVALFACLLGLGRSLYASRGVHIERVLLLGALGAFACYLTAALTSLPVLGLFAVALTGLCASMLWPGNLIVAEKRFASSGVFIFALMAAGGDLGAALGPQMVGVIADLALENPTLLSLADRLSLTPDILGMKLGMLVGAAVSLLAVFAFLVFYLHQKKDTASAMTE